MDSTDTVQARRERLRKLREQRKTPVMLEGEDGQAQGRAEALLGGAAGLKLGGQKGEAGVRRAIRQRLAEMITQSGGKGSTAIPGTVFTEEGVATLLERLRALAQNQTSRGGTIATRVLNFITESTNNAEMVAGVNLNRLQQLSRLAGRTDGTGPAAGAQGGRMGMLRRRAVEAGRVAPNKAAQNGGNPDALAELQRRLDELQAAFQRLEGSIRGTAEAGAPANEGKPLLSPKEAKKASTSEPKEEASQTELPPQDQIAEVDEQDKEWIKQQVVEN